MASIEYLEKEIQKIKERNKRVESDKAWETSWTRRIFVAASTYILISIFLVIIKVEKPFLSAIIPALAYLVSTFSLGVVKSWWLGKRK
jgi:polyferredoxin